MQHTCIHVAYFYLVSVAISTHKVQSWQPVKTYGLHQSMLKQILQEITEIDLSHKDNLHVIHCMQDLLQFPCMLGQAIHVFVAQATCWLLCFDSSSRTC